MIIHNLTPPWISLWQYTWALRFLNNESFVWRCLAFANLLVNVRCKPRLHQQTETWQVVDASQRFQLWYYMPRELSVIRHTSAIWYIVHSRYCKLQSSAVLTRSNLVRYYINDYRNWSRISIRCCFHKRQPIPRPNGRVMDCLLWIFVRKSTTL